VGGVYGYDGLLYYQEGLRKMNAELSIELMVALIITAAFTTLMWWLTNSRDSTAAGVKRGRDDDDKEEGEGDEYNAGYRRGIERAKKITNLDSTFNALSQIKAEANNIENLGEPYISLEEDDGYYAGLMDVADFLEKVIEHETAQIEKLMEASFIG
jgi:hypothetical protein